MEAPQIQRWKGADVPGRSHFVFAVLHLMALSFSWPLDLLPSSGPRSTIRCLASDPQRQWPPEATAPSDSPWAPLTAPLHRLTALACSDLPSSSVLCRGSVPWKQANDFYPITLLDRPAPPTALKALILMLLLCGCSVTSDSATLWTVAHQVLCPQDFLGENTEVGCHFLLHLILRVNLFAMTLLVPLLLRLNPDRSTQGLIHGFLQSQILIVEMLRFDPPSHINPWLSESLF